MPMTEILEPWLDTYSSCSSHISQQQVIKDLVPKYSTVQYDQLLGLYGLI
jgi:hypothetical protein